MEKRVTFKGWLLPLCLIAPQVFISAVFFFYPAGQAVWQSLFIPDPFGLSSQFVGLENFEYLLGDPYYRASFVTTAIFSTLVTLAAMIPALFLAVMADRLVKSAGVYRTLLIWPYAVAPAVAGVLWLFMFNTRVGVVAWYLGQLGYDWNHVLNEGEAMGLVVVASAWGRISYNFLFFFAALQAVPRSIIEAAAIGVPDEKSGEAVKLFVVRKDDTVTEDVVKAHCAANLTNYKRPRFIEFRAELPKTNVGKILRRELR